MATKTAYEVFENAAMEIADRFEASGMFAGMTRKELESLALGYVMGAHDALASLDYEFESLYVMPDGAQA